VPDNVLRMTLAEAVQSLGRVELTTVSWINILPTNMEHVAVFMMALLLPLPDPALPAPFRTGQPRFWPDRRRLLDSPVKMQDQIQELQQTHLLGDLMSIPLRSAGGESTVMWIIETHAGSRDERLAWLRSVITMEGRTPIP